MPVPRAQHVSPWRLVSYGVGTLLLVSLLTWILAELATPDGVKVVTADNLTDLGRTIGLIAAAAVGVPAAVLAYHRQRALDTANRTAAAQQETAARQHEHKVRADDREHHTGVERNLRERYTTCAEQLSHDSSAIRLAGAYAIASLADDWHAFGNFSERQVCIDLLCSYLCLPYEPSGREQTHTKTIIRYAPSDRVVEEHHEHRTEDSQVRQSILRIIAAHLQPDARTSWSESDFDFTGAYLENAEFDGCVFRGKVQFIRARFHGQLASFQKAKFHSERTSFEKAQFHSEETLFDDAQFHSKSTSFEEAQFHSEATTSFEGVQFDGGRGGRTSFLAAQFHSGQTTFTKAQFRGWRITFGWAQFHGGRTSFVKTEFHARALFRAAQFRSRQTLFDMAQFHGGEAAFDRAQFHGTQNSFVRAVFYSPVSFARTYFGGQTSFGKAQFHGSVDFSRPQSWNNVIVDWQWPLADGLEGPARLPRPAGLLPTEWPPVPSRYTGGVTPFFTVRNGRRARLRV